MANDIIVCFIVVVFFLFIENCLRKIMVRRTMEVREKIEKMRIENRNLFGELCYKIGYSHSEKNQKCSFESCLKEIEELDKEMDEEK